MVMPQQIKIIFHLWNFKNKYARVSWEIYSFAILILGTYLHIYFPEGLMWLHQSEKKMPAWYQKSLWLHLTAEMQWAHITSVNLPLF